MLGQLRRWLLSPASALREPALRHLVELCVKKVFTLLLAEARKLGAEIVYADTQTVTIATGKTRLSAAAAFVEGLRASLRRRELFSWLELEPTRQWHALVFRGPYDYGGLSAATLPTNRSAWRDADTQGPDDEQLDPRATGAADAAEAADALDMHWNIAQFLPESLREHFEVLVGEFVFRPWKREHGGGLEDDDEEGSLGGSRGPGEVAGTTRGVALEDEGDDALEEEEEEATTTGDDDRREARRETTPPRSRGRTVARLARARGGARRVARLGADIEGYFSQRVLRLTGEIQKRLGVGTNRSDPRHAFPRPPARTSPRASAARRRSRSSRRRARCFLWTSPWRARWRFCARTRFGSCACPSTPRGEVPRAVRHVRAPRRRVRVLRRLPRSRILCRDERLVEDKNWDCDQSCAPTDSEWVEGALIAAVNERQRSAQLQDLRCARDGRIKTTHLASRCAVRGRVRVRRGEAERGGRRAGDAQHRRAPRVRGAQGRRRVGRADESEPRGHGRGGAGEGGEEEDAGKERE